MTVNRYDGAAFTEVSNVSLADGTDISGVKVRRSNGTWETIWAPVTVIDDLNDGNISEYQGNTSQYSASTTGAVEGTHSARVVSGTSASAIWSLPSSGSLAAYPAEDATLTALLNDAAGASPQLFFNVESNSGDGAGYSVGFKGNKELQIWRWDNITTINATKIASQTTPISNDTWYEIDVERASGTFTLQVYNLNTGDLTRGSQVGSDLTTTDTTYGSVEGVGVGNVSNTESDGTCWDFVRASNVQ